MRRKSFLSLLLAIVLIIGLIPVNSLAARGSLTIRIPGKFDNVNRASLLQEINRIRKEACDQRIYHKDLGRRLDPSDYNPLRWSSELEATAMMRAAESSLINQHFRPNGDDVFSLYPENIKAAENLAFNFATGEGSKRSLKLWYEEKRNIDSNLNPNNYQIGHYLSIINPDYNRVAMASFINPNSNFKVNSQMSLTKSSSDPGVSVSGPLPSEYTNELTLAIEVHEGAAIGLSKFRIEEGNVSGNSHNFYLVATLNSPNYAGSVTIDDTTWVSSNSDILNIKEQGPYLVAEVQKTGKTTLIASVKGEKLASKEFDLKRVSSANFKRYAGKNRIETAIEISRNFYKSGQTKTAIIARSDNFADALSAVPFAAIKKAPILLSESKTLNPMLAKELQRLGVSEIILLGGKNALSTTFEKDLMAISKANVKRIEGESRYATSINIAKELKKAGGNLDKAYFASGSSFPDALSVGPLASKDNHPIILVDPHNITSSTAKAIKDMGVKFSYIVGGPSAVSNNLVGKLPRLVERIYGSNRYETSVAIAKKFKKPEDAFLATGMQFADALASGPVASIKASPILLVEKTKMDKSIRAYIKNYSISEFHVVGGQMAISNVLLKTIK